MALKPEAEIIKEEEGITLEQIVEKIKLRIKELDDPDGLREKAILEDVRGYPQECQREASLRAKARISNEKSDFEAYKQALARHEAGVLTICDKCSKEISLARLYACPTATLCCPCKKEELPKCPVIKKPSGRSRKRKQYIIYS